jgi:hypothetical protein
VVAVVDQLVMGWPPHLVIGGRIVDQVLALVAAA